MRRVHIGLIIVVVLIVSILTGLNSWRIGSRVGIIKLPIYSARVNFSKDAINNNVSYIMGKTRASYIIFDFVRNPQLKDTPIVWHNAPNGTKAISCSQVSSRGGKTELFRIYINSLEVSKLPSPDKNLNNLIIRCVLFGLGEFNPSYDGSSFEKILTGAPYYSDSVNMFTL